MRDQLITDLAEAVAKPSKKPTSAGQVRRSSGTLKTWNPSELRGSVEWNGTTIADVPVLGAIDAFSWQAGDEVIIDTIPGTNGGFSSPMILGRVFRPGTANATRVLQALQNEFAQQIMGEVVEQIMISPEGQDLAAFVIGQRIFTAQVTSFDAITSASYGDIATVGPTVSNVSVTSSGKMLVIPSARLNLNSVSNGTADAYMSFAVSGATTVAADDNNAIFNHVNQAGTGVTISTAGTFARGVVLTGLNQGVHTVQAKYRRSIGSSVTAGIRTMVVIAF